MLAGLKAAAKRAIENNPDIDPIVKTGLFLLQSLIGKADGDTATLAASVKVDGYKVFTIF